MKEKASKFFALVKVDERNHRVYGLVSSEVPDSDNEIADYSALKVAYEQWSQDTLAKTKAAGQEPSLGNIRIQHDIDLGGKATKLETKDAEREIWLESEPVNDEVWRMLKGGFLTGYSHEGAYLWRKCETCGSSLSKHRGDNFCRNCKQKVIARYGSTITSVSYVDKPAQPDATFTYVCADGTQEVRKFQPSTLRALSEADVDRIVKALEVTLGEKADVSELDTKLEKLSAQVAELMGQQSAVGADMNPEQIKKCAEVLGITVEEFTKQYVEGDALEKGKKGLAALHAHLKKAHAHHEKMQQHHAKISEMHKAHGEMHGQMADHLENCMKAHGACMDGEEAEKVLKALVPEPEKKQDQQIDLTGFIKTEDATKMIDEAVKKAIGEQPEALKLRLMPRDGDLEKTRSASAPGGIPLS